METIDNKVFTGPEKVFADNLDNPSLPDKHRQEYAHILAIAALVGDEDEEKISEGMSFQVVKSTDHIEPSVGIYLIENDAVDFDRYEEINEVGFEVATSALSGKVDSAHAVLPGNLSLISEKDEVFANIPVVVKGSFKREFEDRFNRQQKEISITQKMLANGEIGFKPIAAVVSPPVFSGFTNRNKEKGLMLLTHYDSSAVSMDNIAWGEGPNEANMDAAMKAFEALARFNLLIGSHNDAKIKNIIQKPDGMASMIDFETSEEFQPTKDHSDIIYAVHNDLLMLLKSLDHKGFFKDINKLDNTVGLLVESYLAPWANSSDIIQEKVLEKALETADEFVSDKFRSTAIASVGHVSTKAA